MLRLSWRLLKNVVGNQSRDLGNYFCMQHIQVMLMMRNLVWDLSNQ